MDSLELGSGTADLSGGVGNGQATGTGEVSKDFNVAGAVDTISDSLGFGKGSEGSAAGGEGTAPNVADNASKPTPPASEPPAATEAPAAPASTAPKTWKPEEAAAWEAIPPTAKAAIARREEEMFSGIEKYKQTASFGNAISDVLRPYEQLMRQHQIDPVQNIAGLMNAHFTLATGSQEQKLQYLGQIARDYGIDLNGTMPNDDAYQDPQVRELKAELAQLKAEQSSLQQARYQEIQAQTQTEVNAFASDPENTHFEAVAGDVVELLQNNPRMTLQKAYEMAVWSNPTIRAKELERQSMSSQVKANEEKAKKLAEAQQAMGANVRVIPKAGAATLPLGTMDDTMAETLARIKNQSN